MEFVMEPFMWLGIVALFLVIEAVTVGLTTIWFAGGALVAAVASGLGASQAVQWILFFAVSVILLIFTRPLAVRYMNRGVERTNVNRLIGEKAVVIQKISNLDQPPYAITIFWRTSIFTIQQGYNRNFLFLIGLAGF